MNPLRRGVAWHSVHHYYARTMTPSRGNVPFLLRAGHRRNGPSLKPSPFYRRRSTNIAQDSTVSSKAVMPMSTSSSNDVPLHGEYQWGASTCRICAATRAHIHKLCTLRGAFTDFGYTVVRRKTLPPYRKPMFLAFNVTRSVHKEQSKNVFTTLFTNSTVILPTEK